MSQKFLLPLAALFFFASSLFTSQDSAAMPGMAAPSEERVFTGEIVETMNASGYTYMLLNNSGRQVWVAIPETSVEPGSVVSYYEGMVMENFNSKTLNRTFDSIIFSSGLSDHPPAAPGQPADDSFAAAVNAEKSAAQPMPVTAVGQEMSGGSTGAIVPFKELAIEKSGAANGYSVEEVFARAPELSGKKVQIHGKVVKFSPLIMGKNWVHIQDGTGDPMKNSHDLVITTNETVEVDSVVTLEGTLAANKDFGAGYKYEAIVEEAILIK